MCDEVGSHLSGMNPFSYKGETSHLPGWDYFSDINSSLHVLLHKITKDLLAFLKLLRSSQTELHEKRFSLKNIFKKCL